MKIEKRVVKVDLRVDENDGVKIFSGVPIVYGKESIDMGFIEVIARGAATNALSISDIRLLYGHNSETLLPLARTASGTMRAFEANDRIYFEASAPNTQFARDLEESIKRGDVSQMSFAFAVEEGGDKWEKRDGKYYRTVNKIKELYDFSFIAYPAYPDTSVAVRGLEIFKDQVSPGDGATAAEGAIIENEDIEIDLLLTRHTRGMR